MDYSLQDLQAFLPQLLHGAVITVIVSIISYFLALAVGIIFGIARLSDILPIRLLAGIYVQGIRGTPLLLQVFVIYYVLPFAGIYLDPIVAGILALTFGYGAYIAEVVRAGIQAVPRGQWEAGTSLGMSTLLLLRLVILPQAFKIVLPPLGNFFVGIFKDSALLSVITVNELLFTGEQLAAQTYKNFEIFTYVAIIYFCISYPIAKLVELVENHFNVDRRMRVRFGGVM